MYANITILYFMHCKFILANAIVKCRKKYININKTTYMYALTTKML